MAFCRFGKDSEVYVYESVYGGFDTHVADSRPIKGKEEESDALLNKSIEEYLEKFDEFNEDIGLSNDGKIFNDPTLDLVIKRIHKLKKEGYVIPESLIPRLERAKNGTNN